MDIIDVDQNAFMGDLIINLDDFVRLGSNMANGEEDSKRTDELLLRARWHTFRRIWCSKDYANA